MARRSGVAWSAAVAVAANLGCGGSGDVNLSDLPARIVNTVCPQRVHCGEYPDEAACRAAQRLDIRQAQADVAAGTVRYDGSQATACLDAIASVGRACKVTQVSPIPAPCDAIFTGTVADGGACIVSEECVSRLCDLTACVAACCHGTCVPGPSSQIPLGGVCPGAGTCAAGGYCSAGTTPFRCVPSLPEGSSCIIPDSCTTGLACLPIAPGSSAPFACAARAAEGAPCTGPDTCDLLTDFCDPMTSACNPRLAPGSSCDPADDGCVGYAPCDQTTRKCVALGRVGEPCPAVFGHGCLDGLECSPDLTCQVPPPDPVCR